MTDPLVGTLIERAKWYRDGCEGLEDVEGYFASGDCARDAASDLETALSEIRVLENVIAKLRQSPAATGGAAPPPVSPASVPACSGCQRGLPVVLVDEDGTFMDVSGRPGTPSHAVSDAWWPCTRYELKAGGAAGRSPSDPQELNESRGGVGDPRQATGAGRRREHRSDGMRPGGDNVQDVLPAEPCRVRATEAAVQSADRTRREDGKPVDGRPAGSTPADSLPSSIVDEAVAAISASIKELREYPNTARTVEDGDHFSITFHEGQRPHGDGPSAQRTSANAQASGVAQSEPEHQARNLEVADVASAAGEPGSTPGDSLPSSAAVPPPAPALPLDVPEMLRAFRVDVDVAASRMPWAPDWPFDRLACEAADEIERLRRTLAGVETLIAKWRRTARLNYGGICPWSDQLEAALAGARDPEAPQ